MIRIFSSWYGEPNRQRREELKSCLNRNLALTSIDQVCLMMEGANATLPDHPKLRTRSIPRRPEYGDFFQWAADLLVTNDDVSVVSNSDIYFDSSLAALARSLEAKECAALARWDVKFDGSTSLRDRNDSQDVWAFRGKIRAVRGDFPVGVPRCDNRILHELRVAGYEVINPAFSVRCFHLHQGDRGEYDEKNLSHYVDPPYAYLWPHNLFSWPRILLDSVIRPTNSIQWRVDWRWINSTLPVRVLGKLARMLRTRS